MNSESVILFHRDVMRVKVLKSGLSLEVSEVCHWLES